VPLHHNDPDNDSDFDHNGNHHPHHIYVAYNNFCHVNADDDRDGCHRRRQHTVHGRVDPICAAVRLRC